MQSLVNYKKIHFYLLKEFIKLHKFKKCPYFKYKITKSIKPTRFRMFNNNER